MKVNQPLLCRLLQLDPSLPDSLGRTHSEAQVVVHWVLRHTGIEGNKRADEFVTEAVLRVGPLKALAERRKREKQAKRGYRTLAYRPKYSTLCTSDSSNNSDEEEGEGG